MHISAGVKDKRRPAALEAAQASLLPGEALTAIFTTNRIVPPVELLAITDHRILTFVRAGGAYQLVDDINGADIAEAWVGGTGLTGGWAITVRTHRNKKISLGSILGAKKDERAYLLDLLAWLKTRPATEAMRARRHAQDIATLGERQAALTTGTLGQRNQRRNEFAAADQATIFQHAQVFGSAPTKALLQTVVGMARENERPWLAIICASAGALVAFDDRLAIIKVGAMTSFMAGSLGGGRVTTFHFTDITGVEYNSGFVNGVLEILTPSYQGTGNKDFWRGSTQSRNANSNDPYTLSNTLPLVKPLYQQALPALNDLRDRIGRAKQPTIVMADRPVTAAPRSVTDQLGELARLHDAGVLSDEEFAAAKAALIARL